MAYKSKKEQYQAIAQFVGDLVTQQGIRKADAIDLATYRFNLSVPTIYRSIRRCIEIHKKENTRMEGLQNGK